MIPCAICGSLHDEQKSHRGIVVHHRSYDPEVVVWLCRSCHTVLHRLASAYTDDELDYLVLEIKQLRPNLKDALGFSGYWKRYNEEVKEIVRKAKSEADEVS